MCIGLPLLSQKEGAVGHAEEARGYWGFRCLYEDIHLLLLRKKLGYIMPIRGSSHILTNNQ